MASQKNILTTLFAVVFALLCILVAVQASPVPTTDTEDAAPSNDGMSEPRFYGLGGSQATAIASANSMGGGYGRYPYGGGLGIASATAVAQAYGGGMGYPYGK